VFPQTPFVCFHARDPAFYRARPQYQNRYHEHRNSDIESQVPAIELLTQGGYVAFRMGAAVEKPLCRCAPNIIDYPTTARTEFLDIFLCAHCRFYLGDPDGLASVAMSFRRPVAFVNFPALEYAWTWSRDHLFLPKMLWLPDERRFLTFPEIIASGVGRFMRTELFEREGIELISNTPEDITELAVEMDERLSGRWQANEKDEALQRRFWEMFTASSTRFTSLHRGGPIRARIGAAFLRRHQELLEERTAAAPVVVTV
jgi:putative glycosyltransferase (TIGR04372 family)